MIVYCGEKCMCSAQLAAASTLPHSRAHMVQHEGYQLLQKGYRRLVQLWYKTLPAQQAAEAEVGGGVADCCDQPVAAPAAIFSCTPGGLPSCGANISLNWSCTANLNATSGRRRATLAPLPRYSACMHNSSRHAQLRSRQGGRAVTCKRVAC